MLEELVHHRFELPGLSVLERQAQQSRHQVNDQLYTGITIKLNTAAKKQLDQLLSTQASSGTYSDWQRLKREPKKPTNKAIRSYLHHVKWLRALETQMPTLSLPTAKYRQFMLEARALDAKEMRDLRPNKRYALAVILIRSQHGQALDDVAELFIKLIGVLGIFPSKKT
tara:strand:- start:10 stop:516 length:507 start_codon:yes stop_codon:yes gene_type:complete